MTGNTGNIGAAGAAGYYGLADRVDLPFIAETTRVNNVLTPLATLRVPNPAWQDRHWAGDWFAWTIINEFVATNWRNAIVLANWRSQNVQAELDLLARMAEDERADAMGEIITQDGGYEGFIAYFLGVVMAAPNSHPRTNRLLHAAALVGVMAAMHFKANPGHGAPPRPRPTQLLPAVMSPLGNPGHPAYPCQATRRRSCRCAPPATCACPIAATRRRRCRPRR